MDVNLGAQFSRDLDDLVRQLEALPEKATAAFVREHKVVGKRWQAEAVKRAPIRDETLRKRIVTNTYKESAGVVTTECGSNLKYATYVEFGTRRIAGGRVLALGFGPEVDDAAAVKDWPAKDNGLLNANGTANANVAAAAARRAARGSANEQMPWLRPAFNAIRDWAVQRLAGALRGGGNP